MVLELVRMCAPAQMVVRAFGHYGESACKGDISTADLRFTGIFSYIGLLCTYKEMCGAHAQNAQMVPKNAHKFEARHESPMDFKSISCVFKVKPYFTRSLETSGETAGRTKTNTKMVS